MTDRQLMDLACAAREQAYCPYSGYAVGAALLDTDGRVWTGCNVENASYGATNCAERTAFFKAVSEGVTSFEKIAIAGGPAGTAPAAPASPCGICRQVMAEFCPEDFTVLLQQEDGGISSHRLGNLLPHSFGPGALG